MTKLLYKLKEAGMPASVLAREMKMKGTSLRYRLLTYPLSAEADLEFRPSLLRAINGLIARLQALHDELESHAND